MRSPEDIVNLYRMLKQDRAPWASHAGEILRMYRGQIVVPLPELDADEKPAAVNLLGPGLDQMAMRVASTQADESWPSLRDGFKNSSDLARQRRKASMAWKDMNNFTLLMRLRARHLLGYGSSAVTLSPTGSSPFDKREIPHWHVQDPLETYAAPTASQLDYEPLYGIVCHHQTLAWLKLMFPDQYSRLRKGRFKDNPTARFDVIEYHDHEQAGTMLVVGDTEPMQSQRWQPGMGGTGSADGSAPFQVLIGPVINRAEIPLIVFPGRISLGDPMGMFDGLIGKYMRASKLDALQTIAVQRAVFGDEWVVSHPNSPSNAKIIRAADGKTGVRGLIQGGMIQVVSPQPSQMADMAIDRLERTERVETGIPAELNGECVDEKTEILTADGWRHYDQVSAGDEVLTLNHETGNSEWQIVQKMNIYPPAQRTMLLVDGSRFSSLTTLNHRWPILHRADHGKSGYIVERSWKTSETLASGDRVEICAPNVHVPELEKYNDALVELVAWYYTEGNRGRKRGRVLSDRVSITQSVKAHPENVQRIRRALTLMWGSETPSFPRQGHGPDGIPRWREDAPNPRGIVHFTLSAGASRTLIEHAPDAEKIPTKTFLRALTQEQLELFIDVSMRADNFGFCQFGQVNAERAEAFAFACILAGIAVSYHTQVRNERREGWKNGPQTSYVITKRTGTVVKPREAHLRGSTCWELVEHEGMIWCPTTPNGTWFARRNGATYFTGNSATNIRTARRGSEVLGSNVDMPIQESQEIFEASQEAENRRAVAVMKAYYGSKSTSFYVGRDGKALKGADTYVPNEVFETDFHYVKFSMPGTDMNGMIIGMGQRVGLGTLSTETFMETDPFVEDVALERSRVAQDGVRKAFMAFIEQGAANGQIDGNVIAAVLMKLQDPTKLPEDAWVEVHEQLQAQQQAAQEAQQAGQPPGAAAQPGINAPPGTPPGAGAGPGMAISPANPSSQDLAKVLSSLRQPASQSGPEQAMAPGPAQIAAA